jgi:hypothetical protein
MDNLITETTLNRVLHHFNAPGYPCAIITAHRHERSPQENRQRNGEMVRSFKGYGYIPIHGAWKNEDGFESREDSYIVIGHAGNKNMSEKTELKIGHNADDYRLLTIITGLANRFEQEGFVWKSSKPEIMILGRNHQVIAGPFKSLTMQELQQGYTRLKGRGGRVFAFEDAPCDSNWITRMARIMNEKATD